MIETRRPIKSVGFIHLVPFDRDGERARATVARVFVPTDGTTAAQREKYAAYVAARTPSAPA